MDELRKKRRKKKPTKQFLDVIFLGLPNPWQKILKFSPGMCLKIHIMGQTRLIA